MIGLIALSSRISMHIRYTCCSYSVKTSYTRGATMQILHIRPIHDLQRTIQCPDQNASLHIAN